MRTIAETNGQVAHRRVAGKGIDGKGIGTGPQKKAPQKTAPEKVTSTTHVNEALPFAMLEVHQPSEHLLALATLVQDLAVLWASTTPGPEAEDLVGRVEALAAKLR